MACRAVWNEASEQRYIKFWAPLKTHLNGEFQGDIFRIYTESLYCDWIIKFGDITLKINRCILIARAYRFYNLLVSLFEDGSNPTKLQIECVSKFLPKLYCDLNIEDEETAILEELESLKFAAVKVTTPDSEGFITADSSPTDAKNVFYDAAENLEPLHLEFTYLAKELEEQDHLSHLLQSISVKNKTSVKQKTEKVKHVRSSSSNIPRHVKSTHTRNPAIKRLNLRNCSSDMDSGLETASSETSGMDLSDPLQSPFLEQLSTKERRIVNEHDSSSSDTTDDFEDLGKNVRNDLKNQTKEQKQKQNEEIVIMESSSVSSETGSWESVFPRSSPFAKQYSSCDSSSDVVSNKNSSVGTSNGHTQNHYFIDASSLHDESEFCPVVSSETAATATPAKVNNNNKLTKVVKVNELPESQVYDVAAEFQKEIKVSNNQQPQQSAIDCASTSALITSTNDSTKNPKENTHTDVTRVNFLLSKYDEYPDDCDSKIDKAARETGNSADFCSIGGGSGSSQNDNDSGLLTDLTDNDEKDEDDTQKPNFIRSNTFELETDVDDDHHHVTILRQNNERRQGSLIFQNSIQQYSTHSLGLDDVMPVTPHNSIIQLSDQRIVEQPVADCPLDSLFYEKSKAKESPPIAEETDSTPDEEDKTVENLDVDEAMLDLKPIKREESVPIISGGVSSQDFKQEIRTDSPLTKRKLESTPIVSGGMVIMTEPEEDKVEKPLKPIVTAAWVVDMKPEPAEVKKESLSSIESESAQSRGNHKSSLGFYVDLKDIVVEAKPEKATRQTSNESSSENGESGDKKNIFSMFIDFEAPKKSMPSRLSQSLYSKKTERLASTSQRSSNLMKEEKSTTSSTAIDKDRSQSVTNVESEKSVYMFIESDTTVVRRKRSTSNSRPHQNRHSWNSSGGDSDTSTLCHQRTYSLSGNEGSIDLGPRPIISDNDTFIPPKDRKLLESSSSSDENKESSLTENEDQVVDLKKMEVITEVKETTSSGFVRLSDLDKPVPKITTTEAEQTIPARMTRSIPETSWIENKLLMSTSTGCRKSSSRLYPNLSTSTPSNLFLTHTHTRSKSPGLGQDTDEMVSELSDLSSMHSSTALEVSTEETSHSSSYQPHHATDRLGHDLLRMFLEEISPDVTVEVGGRRLKAHKCILSSRCQYFAAMLSGGWVESAGNVISLQGFSYQAVHFAMCHIYSGAADIPETISLVELATLADMLGLEGLKEVVAYTLKLKHCHLFHKPCSVCVVGVLECLPLAAAYGLDDLYRKALRWITRYFVRVWPTRAFAMLPKELMDKCYQQHVVHMSADNVLETTLCCDKLLVTLPSVRWAIVVHDLTSQLADACQHYVTQHFSSVLASASFLSLGKELSWNISRLEECLIRAAERLPPEQSCRSYGRAHRLLALLESGEECWSPNFVELVRKLFGRIEDCVVRQAVRVSYTPAWPRLDSTLRARVQELCCLPLDRPRTSRQPRSTSGSRNLDLRQVRLAMQQHTRRTQSNDSRPATTRPVAKAPPKVAAEPPRPRTWPAQVNNKGKIISSSESSRTSSPAMKRNAARRTETIKPQMKKDKEPTDMSLDSLSSPVNSKARAAAAANKAKNETKLSTDSLTTASVKTDKKVKSRNEIKSRVRSTATQNKIKTASNILKSNIQKSSSGGGADKSVSKTSLPAMNKENQNRTLPGGRQQSKSGSSSSTQHSPSALLRNKQISTNSSSSPGSQPRTGMSPYNGSPSLRRSLLLAARSPQTPVKPVSPATNKRLARIAATAGHSVTSPTKSSAAKCVNTTNVITRNKTATQTHQQRTTTITSKTSQSQNKKQQTSKVEKVVQVEKPEKATVERSGTFLKDEPTVLAKTESD